MNVEKDRKTYTHIRNPDGHAEIEPVMRYITSSEDGFLLLHVEQAQVVLTTTESEH